MESSVLERFWSKVEKTNDCWEWRAGVDSSGYGIFYIKGTPIRASRFAWGVEFGEIPTGICVLHRCDNRLCVKPEHLFLGTKNDNVQDMIRKGRNVVLIGEKHGMSKLKEMDVRNIRDEYATGKTTQRRLSRRYGVSRGMIGHITRMNNWRHLT